MKSTNVKPAALPIIILGGSPISVAVPPVLEAIICVSRNGTGSVLSTPAMAMVTGPIRSTVVTLSRTDERRAVTTVRTTIMLQGRPPAAFADLTARYSNIPDLFTTETNIIMPASTPTVLKSIYPAAVSISITPVTVISTAPRTAATALCTFSVTIRIITNTKTITAAAALFIKHSPFKTLLS